jgi:hypothetical protein
VGCVLGFGTPFLFTDVLPKLGYVKFFYVYLGMLTAGMVLLTVLYWKTRRGGIKKFTGLA